MVEDICMRTVGSARHYDGSWYVVGRIETVKCLTATRLLEDMKVSRLQGVVGGDILLHLLVVLKTCVP